MYPAYSLDQLTAFVAVVEAGSFSGAGRRLGRVQSAISYAIAQLEESLGSKLFHRTGRTPVLTPAGRRLEAEARLVLAQARELTEIASLLRADVEPQLRIVVDVLYPTAHLTRICAAFGSTFPSTALRIDVGLLGEAVDEVRSGRADLGACNLAGRTEPDLVRWHVGAVRLVPVCAPEHPLAAQPPPHRSAQLQRATQIVHSERGAASTEDQGVLATRTLRVTDLTLKVDLILGGVGWGSIPEALAAPHLAAGRLVRLHPEPWPPGGHHLDLHAVALRERPLGGAGQWFRERLVLG